jgi:hypothetical protein
MSELEIISKQIASEALEFDYVLTLWYEHFLLARIFELKVKFENKAVAFEEITKIN